MNRRPDGHCAAVAAAVAALWTTGCFFSGGINDAPTADVDRVGDNDTVHRNSTISFSAAGSFDPDGDPLLVDWVALACAQGGEDCDTSDSIFEELEKQLDHTFEIMVPASRSDLDSEGAPLPIEAVRIEIRVTDPSGARDTSFLSVDVVNVAPTVTIVDDGYTPPQGGNYPIGAAVTFAARGSDSDGTIDADNLTYDWEIIDQPSNAAPSFTETTVADFPSSRRLVADIPGLYEVRVTVTDPLDLTGSTTKTVVVDPDVPPCIRSTDPLATTDGNYIVDTDDVPRRFAVGSVEDDLDYYPAPTNTINGLLGEASFTWFISSPATGYAWTEIVNHEVADYLVDPTAYDPGDTLQLRVEIDDRVGRDIVCDPLLPTCAIGTDTGCLQRVTWGIEIR